MTTENKTWLITGAGRGMGVSIAKAALAAGHNVVATGRNSDAVAEAVGDACSSTTPPASTRASSRSSRPSRWTGRSPRA